MSKAKVNPSLFATIGHNDDYLDRRERLLEQQKRRNAIQQAAKSRRLSDWAWAFQG